MCHTWKLKKVNILPFSGLIYPLMGRKIKIPASCVFSYSFEEHSCAMRTLYYQNCRRSSRKYEIAYLPRKGVMGVKNEKSGFLRFLVWVRKAHSSNYNNLLLKLKEEFEKKSKIAYLPPKWGERGDEIKIRLLVFFCIPKVHIFPKFQRSSLKTEGGVSKNVMR